METDAKGQLGGLEMSEDARKKMAADSVRWRCAGCGKTNQEILTECEKAAKEKEEEGGKREEEAVPSELKMAWKDEMGNTKEKENKQAEEQSSAELAEGFVQTAPFVQSAAPAPLPARPAQTVPQPTGSLQQTLQPPPIRQAPLALAQPRQSNDGVPLWVDRAIAGIVICLAFMILRMVLGL